MCRPPLPLFRDTSLPASSAGQMHCSMLSRTSGGAQLVLVQHSHAWLVMSLPHNPAGHCGSVSAPLHHEMVVGRSISTPSLRCPLMCHR